MAQISSNQIIFDSADFLVGSPKIAALKAAINPSNQVSKSIDPFRDYGILQPGKKPINATNSAVIGGPIIAGVLKDSTLAYVITSTGGKINEFTYSTNTITNAGVFPKTIAGTTPVGQDILAYRHNVASVLTFSPFYTWYNTTDWGVGVYENYTTFRDTFATATATVPLTIADTQDAIQRDAPHPMEVGSDDILYIGSGRYLHAFDGSTGANGTFSARVLTLPATFVITGLLKHQDKLLITGVYTSATGNYTAATIGSAGEAVVYVWNYIDLDVTQIIPLDDPFVSSIFSWRGQVCVITNGESEGFGAFSGLKIKVITGNTTTKIAEIPVGSDVAYRGVDSSSTILYLNSNGKVFAIGDNIKDGYPVNNLSVCDNTVVSGWIKNIVVYGLFLGNSDNNSNHAITRFPATAGEYVSSANLTTAYHSIPVPAGKLARIKSVQVEFAATVSNAANRMSLTLGCDMNGSGGDPTIFYALMSVAPPMQKMYYNDNSGNPFPTFTTIRLGCNWAREGAGTNETAPAISRVIVNYELLEITT